MDALVLGIIALAIGFVFGGLVLTRLRQQDVCPDVEDSHSQVRDEYGSATETMSRVLAELERFAVLRERRARTAEEIAALKVRLPEVEP